MYSIHYLQHSECYKCKYSLVTVKSDLEKFDILWGWFHRTTVIRMSRRDNLFVEKGWEVGRHSDGMHRVVPYWRDVFRQIKIRHVESYFICYIAKLSNKIYFWEVLSDRLKLLLDRLKSLLDNAIRYVFCFLLDTELIIRHLIVFYWTINWYTET